jgi:tetratricopeptide (TPR) repeat protein
MTVKRTHQSSCNVPVFARQSGPVLSLSLALLLSSHFQCSAQEQSTKGTASPCSQFTQEIGELIAMHDFETAKEKATRTVSLLAQTAPRSITMAIALRDLAEVNERMGDKDLAISNYERSLDLRSQLVGSDHVSCEPVVGHLIDLYKAKNDDSSEAKFLERLLRIRKQALSGDCAEIMNPMAELSRLQIKSGSGDGAAKTLNSIADIKVRQQGTDSIAAANFRLVAGVASLNAHDLQKAETCIKQALDAYTRTGGTAESGACYYFLGQIYDQLQLPQKSADSYHSCLHAHKQFGDSNQYQYYDALRRAGQAFVKNGEFRDGILVLNEALPMYEQQRGKNAHCLEPLLLALAECYEHSNAPQQATAYRNRAAHLDPRPSAATPVRSGP